MENKGFYDEHGRYISDEKEKNGIHVNGKDVTMGGFKEKEVEIAVEEEDPWKVTSLSQNYTPWDELTTKGKIRRSVSYTIRIVLVIGCLYMFICSLDFLSSAFKLLGGEAAGRVFQESDIMTNPVAGLMMGVLVTVLVQSSSTSTSIVVSMVGAGILDIKTAIPIVMGANIGTSVTNTIVAIGQISDKGEFRRAFAGATVHDMFNWLTVIILLPIEVASDYLYRLSGAIVDSLPLETNKGADKDILKVITKPFTDLIIQVNKDAITKIAQKSDPEYDYSHAIMKICCDKKPPVDCCQKEVDKFPFISKGQNYTTTQKATVCQSIHHCVHKNTTFSPACVFSPWEYRSVTEKVVERRIDCSLFQATATELACCNQRSAGIDTSTSVSTGCTLVNSCFTSTSHNFTMDSCMTSWRNMSITKKVSGEIFSCTKWTRDVEETTCIKECDFLFKGMYPTLDDKAIGAILLVISLAILCLCLVAIVKLLHSLLKGPMAMLIKKFINADFPGPCAYFTGYLALLIGAGLTIVVQSSSIFTSTLTPLVGIGVIELDRMYPLTLGSNIGTTTTAILSALANSGDKLKNSLQVAFCHLFFNISGIILFYPIPYLRFPIPLAKFLGNETAKYRWYAIVYILFMFFMFPAIVFALSIPGWYVLAGVLGPILLLIIIIAIVKVLQAKKPKALPRRLQDWKFLPKALRSLEPYDNAMQKVFFCKRFKHPAEINATANGKVHDHESNTKL